jgi:hypothetical protein
MRSKRREGRIPRQSGIGTNYYHFLDPTTGREVPVPLDVAAQCCDNMFHWDLCLQDLLRLPSQLVDDLSDIWETMPWTRVLFMIMASTVFTYYSVLSVVHVSTRASPDWPYLAVIQPCLLISAAFAWTFFHWPAMNDKRKR